MLIKVTSDHKLVCKGQSYRCALGKGGVTTDKIEGDGATPVGRYLFRRALFRPDRINEPETKLDIQEIKQDDGWCDDPKHPSYNRPIKRPFSASHEALWRDDHIYDIIVILAHNDNPPLPGKGSAIFFHLARDHYEPTEGCIAVKQKDMLEILKTIQPGDAIEISL